MKLAPIALPARTEALARSIGLIIESFSLELPLQRSNAHELNSAHVPVAGQVCSWRSR